MKDETEKFDYAPPALEITDLSSVRGFEAPEHTTTPIDDHGDLPDPGGW